MLRRRVEAGVRAQRSGGRPRVAPLPLRVAPVPLRVALIAAIVGCLSALIGAGDGFWLAMPGVLLAGSIAVSPAGVLFCAVPVLAADVAATSLASAGSLPPPWLVVLVPAGCLMVLQAMARRLRRERDAMEAAAFSDPLTGLANRRQLASVAAYEIARHRRAGEGFTLLMLDLDGFKLLNDRYGHAAGDKMLREVATRLTRALRSQDTVARLGGDEFCVIAPQTDDPRPLTDKVVAAVTEASVRHRELRTSVGVALYPEDGTTIELLMRAADERLLSAKSRLHGSSRRRAA